MNKKMIIFLIICVSFMCIQNVCVSYAKEKTYGNFVNVEYVRNYDGDTITFNIKGVHPLIGKNISVRLRGIDTPEIRGKCYKERAMAYNAKYIVEFLLKTSKVITLKNVSRGKYFRIVADVYIDGLSLTKYLLDHNYGVPYNGGTKIKDWCIPYSKK